MCPDDDVRASCVRLKDDGDVFLTVLRGKWLVNRATPSWRIKDPIRGFQRFLREERARSMASQVLDKGRSFPNAVVLATDAPAPGGASAQVTFPGNSLFFIVDGQHRVGAENFSQVDAPYACIIHFGLDEKAMARLFLEINDNQRRVPSSLRWDLLRLVEPAEQLTDIRAALIVYDLATRSDSPLLDLIDLTGENPRIDLKQGSIAPEVKSLVTKRGPLGHLEFDEQVTVVIRFLLALRSTDASAWAAGETPYFYNRVMRASLKLLREILATGGVAPLEWTAERFLELTQRIKLSSLNLDEIRAVQGSAGIADIYRILREDVLGG
jgi:DNA sulfur modification protein DndB